MYFDEDKEMIESQQKIIDARKTPKVLTATHDRGVTMFSRFLSNLVAEENIG
jgi:phenylpropionate dioxygenase-like ring-hydroxylating dioxygenase large terminal subunit